MNKLVLKHHEAIALEGELQALLQLKAPVKLKYELTSLLLKLQVRTKAGQQLIQEIFKEHGKPHPTIKDMLQLEDGSQPFKDYLAVNEQQLDELEYKPFKIEWFEGLQSDQNFPVLFTKLMADDNN